MIEKDAEEILSEIENRIKGGGVLAQEDILNLTFAPIMGGKLSKEEKIIRALEISSKYPIDNKEDIQAMLYTFALKFLDDYGLEKIKEVIKMTKLGQMLKEEGRQEGRQEGIQESMRILARNMLLDLEPIEKIIKYTGLKLEEIREIKKEL